MAAAVVCRRTMNRRPLRLFLVLVLALGIAAPALAEDQLLLIVSAQSGVEHLDSPQIRKLFLGLTVIHSGSRLRPLLNESDARMKEIFLQNVVSMSDDTYDRYGLRLSLQQGRAPPTSFKTIAALINAIASDPSAISFAWKHDVEHDNRIRVLRVLWHD